MNLDGQDTPELEVFCMVKKIGPDRPVGPGTGH